MVHSIAKAQSSLISRHRFSGMFEAKLKIRQTDQMETEVGIAVLVVVYMRKIVPAFRADLSTPQQVSPESVDPLANFFCDEFPRPRRGRWLKRTMCD